MQSRPIDYVVDTIAYSINNVPVLTASTMHVHCQRMGQYRHAASCIIFLRQACMQGVSGVSGNPLGAVDQLVFIVNGWCGIVK